jgi:hypothetical protein
VETGTGIVLVVRRYITLQQLAAYNSRLVCASRQTSNPCHSIPYHLILQYDIKYPVSHTLTFDRYLNGRGTNPLSIRMSTNDVWLGTYITVSPGGGRFSRPDTFGAANVRDSAALAQR